MTDFKTCLIRDAKLSQITDQQVYGVYQGASNNTFQRFSAVSTSPSSIVMNVQLPSESVVLNREVLLEAQDFSFFHRVDNVPVGQTAFNYGLTDSLAPFPLAMSMLTLSSQINNTNVSLNLQDILPQLLRMNDSRELYRWNSYAPTLPDQAYFNYSDGVLANNNPLASFNTQSYDLDQAPRGSFPASITLTQYTSAGAFVSNSPISADATNFFIAQVVTTCTEPLFLSPYIFSNPEYNMGGMVGINTINLVATLDSTCKRLWRTSTSGYTHSTSFGVYGSSSNPFQGSTSLLLNFLSTQSTDLIPSRQVVPYMDFPRYLSSNSSSSVSAGASATLTSQNIQLNQLPDKFIICVRKPMVDMTNADSDSFFPITSVSVNLNNQSGLLSSCSPQQLWKLSVEAGSSQSYNEWRGVQNVNNNNTGAGSEIKTIGSLLVLSPAMALSLPAMLSSGSIGQFQMQIQITCTNPYSTAITPEIVIICANSGIMVNASGSSAIYTGILTKEQVVSTATEDEVPALEVPEFTRMVGGKMGNFGALKKMIMSKVGRIRRGGQTGSSSGGQSAHSGGVRRYV
jgi:hypothetical protein